MATLQDILSGNFPAAQRYAEGYAQMPSYLQDPYLGLSTSQVGNVTKGLLSKTQFEKAQEIASKNAETLLGLPKGNTAMERARAMGYETAPSKRLYHYAKQDWNTNVIDPTKSDLGFHVGNVDQAGHRAKVFGGGLTDSGEWVSGLGEGSNIIPLMKSKYSYMLPVKDEGSFHADTIAPMLEKKGILPKGYTKEIVSDPLGNVSSSGWDVKYDQAMRDALQKKGYHGIGYQNVHEGAGKSYAFTDPSMLRSQFAAFDPARANENDILAGLMAIPVSGILEQPKDKKKKK
jgi:hypothetical protein